MGVNYLVNVRHIRRFFVNYALKPHYMSYCKFCKDLDPTHVHRVYHDTQYGFPIADDNALFGRFILEINQAGLSWLTILNKQEAFYEAFDQFDIHKIAHYTDDKISELLSNAGIIRNKLKINAVIYNAQQVEKLQAEYGSFKAWLDAHAEYDLEQWIKLFKKHFKFTGKEITNEFLMSTNYLQGAHDTDCHIYTQIQQLA